MRQEYHPHLSSHIAPSREGTRERGVCEDRWQGVSPGQRRAAQSRVARTVSSLQFRSDIRATSDLRADREVPLARPPNRGSFLHPLSKGIGSRVKNRRPHDRRQDAPETRLSLHDGKKGCVLVSRHVRFSTGLIPDPFLLMSTLDVLRSQVLKLQGN